MILISLSGDSSSTASSSSACEDPSEEGPSKDESSEEDEAAEEDDAEEERGRAALEERWAMEATRCLGVGEARKEAYSCENQDSALKAQKMRGALLAHLRLIVAGKSLTVGFASFAVAVAESVVTLNLLLVHVAFEVGVATDDGESALVRKERARRRLTDDRRKGGGEWQGSHCGYHRK